MNMQVIVSQMAELFILLFLGYFLYKIHIIDNTFNNNLYKLVLYVTIPCMVVGNSLSITKYASLSTVGYVFLIAIATFLLLPVAGYVIAKILKVPKQDMGLYVFMTTFSNIGFIGFPVMKSIFGNASIFYTTVFNMVFNMSVYTYGLYIINMGSDAKIDVTWQKILSPATYSCLFALIIYLAHIHLPHIITHTLTTVGDITTPLAMMIIGATLARIPFKTVFDELRLYPYTILKQLVLPIIAYYLLSSFIKDPLILGVTLICIAMPVGNSAVLFTNLYGGNNELAAKSVFITTIISIITIPIIVALFLA